MQLKKTHTNGEDKEKLSKMVDSTSEQSMIASDPPQWIPLTGVQVSMGGGFEDYNYRHFKVSHYDLKEFKGPKKGEDAPTFSARSINGMQVTLADFCGKFLVLETGSRTCPSYMANIEKMNALAQKYSNVCFVVVYVREAHPGKKIPAHSSIMQKSQNAAALKRDSNEQRLIIVDGLEGAIHRNYGGFPNMVYLVNPTGKVIYRNIRCCPEELNVVLSTLEIDLPISDSDDLGPMDYAPALALKPASVFRLYSTAGGQAAWDFIKAAPKLVSSRKDLSNIFQ